MSESMDALGRPALSGDRVVVDGKFFRVGEQKFHFKAVTYGPFAPDAQGEHFGSPERVQRDFGLLRALHANGLRVYYPPSDWFLDIAREHGLRVLVDIPWPKHLCFLDSATLRREARETVRRAVRASGRHAAVLGYSVVNEIPAEIVRWSGVKAVEKFIEELIAVAKEEAPETLATFTSFPPTEYLHPESLDFFTFNVYLHHPPEFEKYLARLQSLAGQRPLVLGEFGMDSIREGEEAQAAFLSWQIEQAYRSGLAGTVVFSFTDDWYRGGQQIEDWAFGLTSRERALKPSYGAVQAKYEQAPRFPLAQSPKVSVVVASFNGGKTLPACLESLQRLRYPDYEVILVDDGSTDDTRAIAARYPSVRYLHHANQGLSVARNTGIAAARGEVVAFTDSDCRADSDWLYYIVQDLLREDWAAVGGHNLLPPDDSPVAAAVMASPGGPAHVMLTDREAEHVPGCNMVFFKWALEAIGGFDPVFRKAGDDVDVCWRLHELGYAIGFSHAGFVWHHRRSTVRAYLRQQAGYGEAEALLARKHPEYFNFSGGSIWRGRIYSSGRNGVILRSPVIYHGVFGTGFFQKLYSDDPNLVLMLITSLGYHACVNVPLWIGVFYASWLLPLAVASLALSVGMAGLASWQCRLPPGKERFWSRPLVGLLFLLQPVVRGWARMAVRWNLRSLSGPKRRAHRPRFKRAELDFRTTRHRAYWRRQGLSRVDFLRCILRRMKGHAWWTRVDSGWGQHDLEVLPNRWTRLCLTTVAEDLDQGNQVIRGRCDLFWSSRSWLLMSVVAGVVALFIGSWAAAWPWRWMALAILPMVAWYLEEERAYWGAAIMGVMDEIAEEAECVRLEEN